MAHHSRFSGDCAAEAKTSDATTIQNKARKLQVTLENFLSLGNDPELFSSLKQVTRSPTCHNCGLTGSSRCSRCHQTYYCSVNCQKQDWKAHSVICRPAAQKELNGINPPSGADNMNAGHTKAKASRIPDPKNEEVNRKKIMLCDIQEEALKEGTEFPGYAVEFSSPSNFCVKSLKSVDNLVKVTSSLKIFYSNPSNIKKGYTPDTGEVCVAKYHQDQQWYRVLVYNVEATMKTAQVLYLDYGNTETVSLDCVQPMHKDVELGPPCALHCCLAHVTAPPYGWSSECLVEVKSLLVGHKLLIRIIDVIQGELPRYMVDVSLLDSGEHVNKIIIEKGYSFPPLNKNHGKVKDFNTVPRLTKQTEMPNLMQVEPSLTNAAQKPETLSSSLRVGDHFVTLVTVIHNPEMFFCQQAQNAKQLSEVMIQMYEHYSTLSASPGYLPAPGELCAARFTEDNNWYRASVVRQVSDESVLVGYLDFGNTETLPISRVHRIESNLLSIPFQAVQCCLAGVKPQSGEWTSEATDAFKDLVMNKILTACVVADCDRVLTLELIDESVTPKVSISQHLIKAGLAVSNTPDCETSEKESSQPEDHAMQLKWSELPLGQETEVLVCMLQNPGEFFCHIHNQTDLQLLNELNISLGQYCMEHKSEGYYPAREEICGACYAGDRNWYRAQVKDFIPVGTAKILFLDYGNIEKVSLNKLCKIPSSFLEFPFQAICCSLSGVKPAGENWSEDSAKAFQKSVVGLKLLAKAVIRTKHSYSVELVAAESGAVIADVMIATKVAVRDEKSVKEKIDVNNNKALRPPRDLLLTSKVFPVWNSDKGAPTYKELLSPRNCNSSPSRQSHPLESSTSILRDAHSAIPKTPKALSSPNAVPKDLVADQTGGKGLHSSNVIPFAWNDVCHPKSILSTARDPALYTLRAPHSNNSMLGPKESHGPKSTSTFQKEAQSRNPNSLAPRGGLSSKSIPMVFSSSGAPAPVNWKLHPSNLSPSSQKGVYQAESFPTARKSRFTNSTSLIPSEPNVSISLTPIPGEMQSCVSPSPIHHQLLQSASPVDSSKLHSHHSTPLTSREFHFCNSSPTALSESTSAERQVHSDNFSLSNESLHGEIQNLINPSVNGHSAVSQGLPGVSCAQSWISLDLSLNKAVPACVLKVISPDLFYIFPKENKVDVKRLQQVMMEIFEYCSKETNQHNYRPSIGDACCAKFTEDGQWYRAVVLEVHDSTAKIVYADYGNLEVLPFSCLLPMKGSFLELPMQLTKCSLADVLPVTEPWPPEATCTLSSLLLGEDVLITPKLLDTGIYSVSVDKKQENGILHVAEKLVEDGLARSVTVVPINSGCSGESGCCCHNLLKRMEKLEEIIMCLLSTETFKKEPVFLALYSTLAQEALLRSNC